MTAIEMEEETLFGWDEAPGIVSVWADHEGQALIWRRVQGELRCERERFRPWLLASHLDDLARLGGRLAEAGSGGAAGTVVQYRALDGDEGSYRYLLTATSGRELARAIVTGASARLGRSIRGLFELDDYYRVGTVEQYLMSTGRVYFRGLRYDDLQRMQIDLETTSLDPETGRIFLVAVRDSRGLEITLEAPEPEDEPGMIAQLVALVRERDPDVIENHNLSGFDLPFLWRRAQEWEVPLTLGRAPGPALLERHLEGPGGKRARFTMAGRELIDTLLSPSPKASPRPTSALWSPPSQQSSRAGSGWSTRGVIGRCSATR